MHGERVASTSLKAEFNISQRPGIHFLQSSTFNLVSYFYSHFRFHNWNFRGQEAHVRSCTLRHLS